MKGISVFFSYSNSLMLSTGDFLLKPIFGRGFSASLHLLLLLALLISWVFKKINLGRNEAPRQSVNHTRFLYYKQTLFCCLGLSLFNLVMCLLNYFYWYRNGWYEEMIVTVVDLLLKTLTWLALSVYLHTQFSKSGEPKFPLVFRVWWGFYFSISCYCLVIDLFIYKKHQSFLPTQFWVSDIVSALSGLFLCFVGMWGKNESEDTVLQEPLLTGNASELMV